MENLTGVYINLSRAYEIARLGGFSISVFFDKEYSAGFEDYKEIKKFFNMARFKSEGDLCVEIYKPDLSDKTKYETLQDIEDRVKTATKNKKPSVFANNACQSLLDQAVRVLSIPMNKRRNVINIASVIAQLDGSEKIKTEHVAEAIQYQIHPSYAAMCNAENETTNFGKGISIKNTSLNPDDVKNAIEYLSNIEY